MNFTDIIIKKRDGQKLSKDELYYFANSAAQNTIPDYQISALLMAIFINGLDDNETAYLTEAMTNSGDILDLSDIKGFKIDKHSTGGVGDTTTLVLAPLVAACGLPVVKMSGRGLGHTGGTLDKLESIQGFNININANDAIEQVNKHNIVVMGQTSKLAPADKTLYALRDVTGTIDSIPLIASSIMSKKLAGGADGIVLDVKLGSGAFMSDLESARKLSDTMISIGKKLGKKMCALITDMNEPLGMYIGNSLEVIEAIEILNGNVEGRLKEVSLALASEMLVMGGISPNKEKALELLNQKIQNGDGISKFKELITLQGGNPDVTDDYSLFAKANESYTLYAPNDGYINSINAYEIGRASLETGAGRRTKADKIDYSAGIIMHKKTGDKVNKGDVIAEIFSSSMDKINVSANIINSAVNIGDKPVERPIIYEVRR